MEITYLHAYARGDLVIYLLLTNAAISFRK